MISSISKFKLSFKNIVSKEFPVKANGIKSKTSSSK
jgi:hypothetical protein